MPGRRPASYWFKSERTGTAQQQLGFLAEEERDDLPLVNALREDVKRWREFRWENASETTKKLLRHWWREDRCGGYSFARSRQRRRSSICGRFWRWEEAAMDAEAYAGGFQYAQSGPKPAPKDWIAKVAQHPKLADIPNEPG